MAVRTSKPRRERASRSRPAPRRLQLYHAKRDLAASSEPADQGTQARRGARQPVIRRFVIQKHDATRLHYDFRLEMEGVLRSWAVPKGLPTSAGGRSLAVEVEDHPLAYGEFEGTIPEGNYGAGTVMLWDRGSYTVDGGTPEESHRKGKIHLALAGQKCVGEWTLVRMRPRPGEKQTNWLVIKNSGAAHRAPISGRARDLSVASGRSLDEITAGKKPGTRAARVRTSAPRRRAPRKTARKPATRAA